MRSTPPNKPLHRTVNSLVQIDLGCSLAAYWVDFGGTRRRCCRPVNADPLGVMSKLKLRLCRALLPRILERVSPDVIPRSPPEGNRVNCFSVSIDRDGEPYFLVSSFESDRLHGRIWDGSSYSERAELALSDIDPDQLFVRHYYGLSTVKYLGILDLAYGRTLFLPYLHIHIQRVLDRFRQYRFNQTRLATKRRMELLYFLLERQFEAEADIIPSNIRFHSLGLMSGLYSERWILHPEGSVQRQTVEFYLESLVQSGDLQKPTSMEYELTPKALQSAEEYQEQTRKHTQSISMQRRMFWLTLAIVLLAAVQAGIVKLPVLLDLSAGSTTGEHSRR